MDCRRWVVDDDRSRKKWAVDEDRCRIRWAIDEDRRRRRWAVDEDHRRRRWAVDDEEDDYPPLQLPLQWRDPLSHYPHEDGHRRRRDVDRDRRCEALPVQVEASIDRIDVSFADFNHSLERVCTSVSKLSSAIYSHSLSTDFALARFPLLPHGSPHQHPPSSATSA
ncbi:uncharacterized protein LOC110104792 [Dendrobium catenatum]|uniref:uncharacterized protein LOC110104792 n=1 Tax=Dendrobium catenatum TaxID=906689 RepID=UPI0009F5AAB3|nr:uncharacterized protein LOC110104792 [Dendrobium catenatum]